MIRSIGGRGLTRADVIALLALFVALGGTATAVSTAVKNNSVGQKQLKKKAVRAKHIKPKSVRAKHIKPEGIRARHLGPRSVGPGALGEDAVGPSHVKPGGITRDHLSVKSVGSAQIIDNSVGKQQIDLGALGVGPSLTGGSLRDLEVAGGAPGGATALINGYLDLDNPTPTALEGGQFTQLVPVDVVAHALMVRSDGPVARSVVVQLNSTSGVVLECTIPTGESECSIAGSTLVPTGEVLHLEFFVPIAPAMLPDTDFDYGIALTAAS